MKSVALYGFATLTREGIWQTQADEIWSIAWAYKYATPRIDRLLEIHPIWLQARSRKPEYEKARAHWAWLQANTTTPVYMLEQRPEVPRSIRYPLEAVQALLPPTRRKAVLTSSFDYLMALAVLEGAERIETYGFEMGSDTEYRYQREGAAYWIAQCDARGIEVVLPPNTKLLSKKLYGFEGGSVVSRQDLERMREVRVTQRRDAFAKLAMLEGKLQAADAAGDEAAKPGLAAQWDEQYRLALVTAGALQEIEYILKEIDLEEPDLELVDPMEFIKVDG